MNCQVTELDKLDKYGGMSSFKVGMWLENGFERDLYGGGR